VIVDSRNPIRDIPHYLGIFQTYLGRRMYLVYALAVFAALAEGFGIVMVLPLLQTLDAGTEQTGGDTGQLPTQLIDSLGFADSTVALLLIITAAFVLKGLLLLGALGVNAYLRAQLLRELKGRLFDEYSLMDYRYYSKRDTGHFINVINGQVNLMLVAFQNMTKLGSQLVTMMLFITMALAVAWRFGLMAVVLGTGLLLSFRGINNYVRRISRKTAQENGRLGKLLIQFLHGFKYLTATAQARLIKTHVMESVQKLTGFEMRKGIAESFTSSIREPIAVVFIMAIVLVQLVVLEQPLAPIMVSILLFHRGFQATMHMQAAWQATLDHIGSVEMVRDEIEAQRQHREPDGAEAAPSLQYGVALRGVYFSYAAELGDVLHDVTLEIPVRTSVALVGESGAGKSTVADLVTLMLKPRLGEVLIDGIPGSSLQLDTWRRQIGYVSQETVVFDDSIANNICMWQGNVSSDADLLVRVREAARQAHISDFVEGLPEAYETLVGDRGMRLSGGQRQRLFIARELFREPKLLILDEATSALDTESERAIQRSIDALKGRITVIIIAHRLSTIRNVDHVYVFDKGRLVEHGAYEELRDAERSRFGELIAMQAL
jgi:ABC-type multidrug transport system fused ATPase/permease subunit